jgi:hypothetical protein
MRYEAECALRAGETPRKTRRVQRDPQKGQWLPSREAAEYCAMGFSTFARMRMTGEGAPYAKVGQKILYNRDDLDAWLKSKSRTSTSQSAD